MNTFEGWYCAHCQRGVDASEVTFYEQHTVCGRTITDDVPPKASIKEPVTTERHDNLPHMTSEQVSARAKEFAARCKSAAADAEQPEDGPAGWRPMTAHRPRYGQRVLLRRSGVVQIVAPTFDSGDDGDFWDFFGIDSAEVDWEHDEWMPLDDLGGCWEAVKAERDALRERVKELEADAKRWHFVRQFMCLDDVGDEDFCLGLITYGESLSERVDPAAQRLYKDRWDARCRAEYRGEELDQGEITVDEAIDAAMQEGKS